MRWKPIFSLAEIGGSDSAAESAEREELVHEKESTAHPTGDEVIRHIRQGTGSRSPSSSDVDITKGDLKPLREAKVLGKTVAVTGMNRPLFHVDLTSALQSAVANVRERERIERGEAEADERRRSGEEP